MIGPLSSKALVGSLERFERVHGRATARRVFSRLLQAVLCQGNIFKGVCILIDVLLCVILSLLNVAVLGSDIILVLLLCLLLVVLVQLRLLMWLLLMVLVRLLWLLFVLCKNQLAPVMTGGCSQAEGRRYH